MARKLIPERFATGFDVADIVLVNDYDQMQEQGKMLVAALRKKGHETSIETMSSMRAMEIYLSSIVDEEKMPGLFMLDVMGVGCEAAEKILEWHKEHRPDFPEPEIHFFSSVGSLSADTAGQFRRTYPDSKVEYIYPGELAWLIDHLNQEPVMLSLRDKKQSFPASLALRRFVNEKTGMDVPLVVSDLYEREQGSIKKISNSGLIQAWKNSTIDPAEAIERLRNYVTGIADALRQGLYMIDPAIGHEARFYESAGFPAKGPAVFSMQEAETMIEEGDKPVLIMQSYDPELMQIVKSGKLGGLVIISPYMASHIKFICDSNNVPGLFGLIPKGAGGEYDETVKPDGPAWVEGEEVTICGHKIAGGQMLLLDSKNSGVIADKEKINYITDNGKTNREVVAQQEQDGQTLAEVNSLFARYFSERGIKAAGIKANVDSTSNKFSGLISVGLVRTEQMILGDSMQADIVREILLRDDDGFSELLREAMINDYEQLMSRTRDSGTSLRIRLLDWPLQELLDQEDQQKFIQRYGTMDIEGGAALKTWPAIYQAQADAVVSAAIHTGLHEQDGRPLEIMMPSIRTEEETLQVKALVETALKKKGVPHEQIKFGVMVETVDSAKNIEAIAPHVDFISFGTNDLTQEKMQIERGDYIARQAYKEKHGIDPFTDMVAEVLGVVKDVTARARQVNPSIQVDVCGAQATDLKAAFTLNACGINNISVSPVPANLYALPALLNYRIFDASRQRNDL